MRPPHLSARSCRNAPKIPRTLNTSWENDGKNPKCPPLTRAAAHCAGPRRATAKALALANARAGRPRRRRLAWREEKKKKTIRFNHEKWTRERIESCEYHQSINQSTQVSKRHHEKSIDSIRLVSPVSHPINAIKKNIHTGAIPIRTYISTTRRIASKHKETGGVHKN